MAARKTRRRSPGEGGCWSYKTKAGERWRARGPVRMADGTVQQAQRKGFLTKSDGLAWLAEAQSAGRKGEYIAATDERLGSYGRQVIEGLRLSPQTQASYLKNWRLHIEPYPVAQIRLAQVTGTRLTGHYRELETSGRRDHREGEGLSARTTRYIATIIHKVLAQAVRDGLVAKNAADAATPPSAREARPPEMQPWTEPQLAAFLAWSAANSGGHALWHTLAYTGARRGEMLALRWRDVDLESGTVTIRRSAGLVRTAGVGAAVVEGLTKSGKPRLVSIDSDALAVLKAHKAERGKAALELARPDSLVFGTIENGWRNPEHTSRQFARDIQRCQAALGSETVPVCRLHDLRHAHASILLTAGVPVHVVSKRLGHASPVVTMTVYAHLLPGSDEEAALTFGRRIRGAA